MQSHTVTGGNGINLHVDETGQTDGQSILFVHGYSQSRLSWDKQMHSDLADEYRLLAMDIRGHGNSDKPKNAYDRSSVWADDIQAVIEELELDQPVLAGWSYGGLVLSDYLSEYGTEHIAGLNFVGAISKTGTEDALAVIGDKYLNLIPGFESTDAEESVDTLETFIERCVYDDLSPQDHYRLLGFNTVVPPYVREGLHTREVTHDDDLRVVDVPTLITHGEEDSIVLPAAAEEHAGLIETAELSWFPETGHSPFWERPERYNRELREFVEDL